MYVYFKLSGLSSNIFMFNFYHVKDNTTVQYGNNTPSLKVVVYSYIFPVTITTHLISSKNLFIYLYTRRQSYHLVMRKRYSS